MDNDTPLIDRRGLLAAAGLAAGAAAVLAVEAEPADAARAEQLSPAAATGQKILKLSAVPVGGSVIARANGKPVVLSRTTAKKVVCHSAICTHQGCPVNADGAHVRCPCHGSLFRAATGAVLAGPADQPLPAVRVKVSGGWVRTA